MAWVLLIIASFGEIFGVMSINLYLRKRSFTRLLLIIITFTFGFFFLSKAMQEIPMSTAYAVWTGVGAGGAVLMGIIFFKESASWLRILFLFLIISGVTGLKLIS